MHNVGRLAVFAAGVAASSPHLQQRDDHHVPIKPKWSVCNYFDPLNHTAVPTGGGPPSNLIPSPAPSGSSPTQIAGAGAPSGIPSGIPISTPSGAPGGPPSGIPNFPTGVEVTFTTFESPIIAQPTFVPQPSGSAESSTAASSLTCEQQAGNSTWGTIDQPYFPKWLDGSDEAPWGERTTTNADATVKDTIPDTGVTRHYDWTISRGRLSPDGVLRDMILINGQYPGPAIEANWGDMIEVTVHNRIEGPSEGTSFHWHGMLQYGTQWEDGTPGVSQCPIAPGESQTYRFQAQQFGTSFYHAHYSAQYTAGVIGPMQIYGPSSIEYDIDVGSIMLSDWNHIPYFSMVSNVVGTNISVIPPTSDDGLINGRGRFNCSNPSYSNSTDWLGSNLGSDLTWTCVDGAERAKFRFQSGKTHRLRLMNIGADGIHKFSIDGHTMTVIATDYVPSKPYTTDVVTLGVGQRTDVIVTANGDPKSSYWMRTELPGGTDCGGLGPLGVVYPQVMAAIYYEDADASTDPDSTSSTDNVVCDNDALDITQPEYSITPSADPYIQDLTLSLVLNTTGNFEFRVNNQTYQANFNEPVLYKAANGIVSYPANPQWNMYNFDQNTSVVLNVTNQTPFWHPFHLHGHNFYVLSTGPSGEVWDGSVINPSNPMRRDVQIVPAGGYAAIQFEQDNPGVWPFHCHVAWHLSGGLSITVISRPGDIGPVPDGARAKACEAWDRYSASNVVDQIDSGS